MAERIVVAYKATLSSLSGRLASRAKSVIERAEAMSGELVAWSATEFAISFPPDGLERALALVRQRETLEEGETAFACAIAQGDLSPLAEGLSLSWGTALVVACSLAQVTSPGEVTVSEAVKAFRQGELLTQGPLSSRAMDMRLRGARLDVAQPLRRDAAAKLSRVRPPAALVGVEDPGQLVWPGSLSILRADPGLGGTRFLMEIARTQGQSRALFVSPSGSGLEPFGALRRAIMRSDEVNPFLMELAPSVERLTMGDGVTMDEATRIVAAFLWPKSTAEQPGPLLLDDVSDVDEASLQACTRALMSAERSFPFVIRLDATGQTPRACSELAPGPEAELLPLPRGDAEQLATGAIDGSADEAVRRRYARLGGNSPLGVVEAMCHGIGAGDIVWDQNGIAHPRRRSSGKGRVRPARQWITLRAMDVSAPSRTVLALLAMLGGEASVARLERVIARAERTDVAVISPRLALEELGRAHFMSEVRDGHVALPSRTHRDALADILDEPQKKTIHRLICDVLEAEEGRLARAEAAYHAARAGDGARAAKLALSASRAATELGLDFAAVKLLAFAREQDPSVQAETRARVASSIPPRAPDRRPASEPRGDEALTRHEPRGDEVLTRHEPRGDEALTGHDRPATEIQSPVARLLVAAPPPAVPLDLAPAQSDREGIFSAVSGEIPESNVPFTQQDPPASLDVIVPAPALERGTPSDHLATESERSEHEPQSSSHSADSEPPTVALAGLAPLEAYAPKSDSKTPSTKESVRAQAQAGEDKLIAERLTELAKEALLGADTAALERWVDNLGATGEHAMLADRMRAMARLSRGEIGDALRVLKRARVNLPKEATVLRCQTSLALGMALAVAGRSEEALLEGLDALSRAKQGDDARGTSACLAFLAKLYASVERADDARRLRLSAPPPT